MLKRISIIIFLLLNTHSLFAEIPSGVRDVIEADVSEVYPYALFSKAAYEKEDNPGLPNWGYLQYIKGLGFRAEVYKNNGKKEILIAFSGTDSLFDAANDAFQMAGQPDPQYHAALSMTMAYLLKEKDSGYNVVLTGHSLGGGMAQFVAKVLGLKAYTFNPAPINDRIFETTIVSQVLRNQQANIFNIVGYDKHGNYDLVSLSPGKLYGVTKRLLLDTKRLEGFDRHSIKTIVNKMAEILEKKERAGTDSKKGENSQTSSMSFKQLSNIVASFKEAKSITKIIDSKGNELVLLDVYKGGDQKHSFSAIKGNSRFALDFDKIKTIQVTKRKHPENNFAQLCKVVLINGYTSDVYLENNSLRGINSNFGSEFAIRLNEIKQLEFFQLKEIEGETINPQVDTNDTRAPAVTIKSPTSGSIYATSSDRISLSGQSSDAVGVTRVHWSNSRGGSGMATGTTNWSISGISLAKGDNILTITATNEAGNTSTDTITVTYSKSATPTPKKQAIRPEPLIDGEGETIVIQGQQISGCGRVSHVKTITVPQGETWKDLGIWIDGNSDSFVLLISVDKKPYFREGRFADSCSKYGHTNRKAFKADFKFEFDGERTDNKKWNEELMPGQKLYIAIGSMYDDPSFIGTITIKKNRKKL